MVKKIIVFGFAHSGTTILKSIIGHIEQVEEIHNEQKIIKKNQMTTDKDYIICKWPDVLINFFEDSYKDYIKIFIVRNPLWVFSSLNRRNNAKMLSKYSISKYNQMLQLFHNFNQKESVNDLYTIKYEDLFENNFKNLKDIFDKIGLIYNEETIFDNNLFTNICNQKGPDVPIEKPDEIKHGHFRKWQINQPIANMNEPSKIQ